MYLCQNIYKPTKNAKSYKYHGKTYIEMYDICINGDSEWIGWIKWIISSDCGHGRIFALCEKYRNI